MKNVLWGIVALAALATGLALAADVGPKADVAAVRAASAQKNPQAHLLGVHVVGDYALTDWYQGEARATRRSNACPVRRGSRSTGAAAPSR